MKKVLIVYWSRTGRTEKMAKLIAEGIRSTGNDVETRKISEIRNEKDLEGYDGYLFGCPTYFRDMTEKMKTFLFTAQKAGLEGKFGGAFGSYTHVGSAPKIIADTMQYVFRMNTGDTGPFNVKEQMLDRDIADQACLEYGKSVGEKLSA